MPEQRRIGYRWHLRHLMAQRNLWKSTELQPLLQSRELVGKPGLPFGDRHSGADTGEFTLRSHATSPTWNRD